MNIGRGASNWSQLRKTQVSAENAAGVNVPLAGIEIVAAPQVTVAVGDQLLVSIVCNLDKGVANGRTDLAVENSGGTGSVRFGHDQLVASLTVPDQAASTSWFASATFQFAVTTGGTVTMHLTGASAGSDATVGAGSGQIRVDVIRGQ